MDQEANNLIDLQKRRTISNDIKLDSEYLEAKLNLERKFIQMQIDNITTA